MSKGPWRVCGPKGQYRLVDGGGAIVKDIDRFLSALEARGLSPFTVRAYAYDLLILIRWLEQTNRAIRELTQNDILEFIRAQREINAHPKSINRRLVVTELWYRFLTGHRLRSVKGVSLPAPYYKGRRRDRELGLQQVSLPRNRFLRVKTPRKVVEPLTSKQVKVFLRSLRRYRDIAIVHLMLFCGLRSCEVLSLRKSDVLFDEQRLHIQGKGNKERVLPLPGMLFKSLGNYLKWERPSLCHGDALFVILQGKRRGQPMTADGLRSLFRHRRRNTFIKGAHPHRFRHTFGADMARSGVRLPILQRMMGHSDSTMTLQYINLSMADIAKEYLRATQEIEKRYQS